MRLPDDTISVCDAAPLVLQQHQLTVLCLLQILKLVQTQAHPTITPLFYCKNILPIGLFMALTLHFGNVVYLHLTMSFIQILKVSMGVVRGTGYLAVLPAGKTDYLYLSLTWAHNLNMPRVDVRRTATFLECTSRMVVQ